MSSRRWPRQWLSNFPRWRAAGADGLDRSYKLTLRILFRLLFQAYAEDRGLLPFGRNPPI